MASGEFGESCILLLIQTLMKLLDMDYKPNTLVTALSQKPYKLTAGNINLSTGYPSRVNVISGIRPVRDSMNGLNASILD